MQDELSDLWLTEKTAQAYPDPWHTVVPKPKKGPEPMEGQMTFENSWRMVRDDEPWPVYTVSDLGTDQYDDPIPIPDDEADVFIDQARKRHRNDLNRLADT